MAALHLRSMCTPALVDNLKLSCYMLQYETKNVTSGISALSLLCCALYHNHPCCA